MRMFIIAVISFVSMVYAISEINELKRKISIGDSVQVRGVEYECKKTR